MPGFRPPPAERANDAPVVSGLGCVCFATTSVARCRLTKVHVTVSSKARSMFEGGLPSEQVALVRSQPDGTLSAMLYPVPGARSSNRADSPSFSANDAPQLRVNENEAVLPLGWVVLAMTIVPGPSFRFVNVHVTVSPGRRSILDTGLSSEQLALLSSQPVGTVSPTL